MNGTFTSQRSFASNPEHWGRIMNGGPAQFSCAAGEPVS